MSAPTCLVIWLVGKAEGWTGHAYATTEDPAGFELQRGVVPEVARAVAVLARTMFPPSSSLVEIMVSVGADGNRPGGVVSANDDARNHFEVPLAPEVGNALAVLLRATILREAS